MTNVLGDALAAGIIQHVCEKDFAPKAPKVRLVGYSGSTGHSEATQTQRTRLVKKLKQHLYLFSQQDTASNTDKFPSAEPPLLHPKDNVIHLEDSLFEQMGGHYNICQV